MNKKEKTKILMVYLQGTCISLDEGLKNLNLKENEIDLFELENWISYCDGCSWWYETGVDISDIDGLQLCDDCIEEF